MKICPKCNELNGDNRTDCFKCKTPLEPSYSYKKVCSKCSITYGPKAEYCDKCGGRLSVYSNDAGSSSHNSGNRGCWMYIVSIIIPIVGIILGCIYIAKNDDDLGESLIITGVVSIVLRILIGIIFGGCTSF